MAHRILLKLPGSGFLDYTKFVFLPDQVTGGGQSIAGGGTSQSTQQVTLQKTWELGLPPQCTFFVGGDLLDLKDFVPPETGTEVWIDSDTFPEFFTGFITNEPEVIPIGGTPGTSDLPKDQLLGYVCACQGHEILLDMNRIGFIPPFTNMTVGAIIAALGEMLVPGRFTWTGITGFGSVIPIYTTKPDQRFSDVVKDLLQNQATKLWFVRYVANIAHFDEGNPAVEPTVSETDAIYNPYDLAIKPIANAIINDVTGIGDTEPQAYCREYTVGDGITTDYPLELPVFGALGKPVVEDDFTGDTLDPSIWAPFGVVTGDSSDPSHAFQLFNGRLNVVGGLGLNSTKLLLALGIEIKGSVNLDAGEIQFVDATDAIVGGFYTSQTLTLANCKYGFRVTGGGGAGSSSISGEHPSGNINGTNVTFFTSQVPSSGFSMTLNGVAQTSPLDYTLSGNVITFVTPPPLGATILCSYNYATGGGVGISIQAIVNGALVGDIVTTKPSMTYSLHIKISTPAQQTNVPPWYSSGSAFGGGSQTAPVTVSFLVEEFSQLAVRLPNDFNIYQVVQTGVPAFLFVGEFSVNTANLAINYFQITTPIQGSLLTQLRSDDAQKIRVLGFVGQNDADATVTVTQESEKLSFFKESRPVLRQRNEFRYRSAGPAVARVVSSTSIAKAAAQYGDSGVRSALLTNLVPLPATSEQLEWALQAYLDDNDTQQFEGTLIALTPPQNVVGVSGSPPVIPPFTKPMTEPIPGRFINVITETRTPEQAPTGFSELIKVVTISVTAESDDGTLEQFEIQLDYGLVVTREMQKVLENFSRPDPPSVAVLRQISNVPAVDTTLVGTQYIEDPPAVALLDKDNANFYYDLGQNLNPGESVEVRYSDASWGQLGGVNFIGRFNTRLFAIPRKMRDQTIFVKIVQYVGSPATGYTPSRYPAMVRTLYQLVPPQPGGSEVDTSNFSAPKIHFDLPPVTLDTFGILIQSARTLASGQVTLQSSSAADFRGMLVVGQAADGSYMEEKIFLNGTAAVTTTKSFNWILWVNSDYGTVLNEVPSPNTDGTTVNFNLAKNPIAGTIVVYVDGTAKVVGVDYNIVTNQIQFINPPTAGSQILVNYLYQAVVTANVAISSPLGALGNLNAGALQWLADPVLYRYEDLSFGGSNQDPALTFTFDNSANQSAVTLYVYFYNLLDELSLPYVISPNFGPNPVTGPNVECLDVRNFGAKGDFQSDDTGAVQAALDQAARNVAGPTSPVTSPTVIGRPTVLFNGWGANAHVGDYEHGVNQGHFWGTDPGTTLPYSNPGNAIDTDASTYAQTVQQHTHQYSGIVFQFGALPSPSPSLAQRYLNIISEVPANGDGGVIVTDRTAGAWYSLDSGTTWKLFYNINYRTKQMDSVLLPPGQDPTHIQVMFFSDSHDDMVQYIYDVNITQLEPVASQIQASGPTTVCIPSGVNCMVGGLQLTGGLPADQTTHNRALNIQSGVALKIDGSLNLFSYAGLVAQSGQFICKELIGSAPGSSDITISGAGSINGNTVAGDTEFPLIDLHGHDFTIQGTPILTIKNWGSAVLGGSPAHYAVYTGVAINMGLDLSNTNTSIDSVTFLSVMNPIWITGSRTGGSPDTLANATLTNGVNVSHCIGDPCFYAGIRVTLVQKLNISNNRFSLIGQSDSPSFDGGISCTDIKNFTIEDNICNFFDSGYATLEAGAGINLAGTFYGCSDGLITKNTCNDCNNGISCGITNSQWQRVEISFNICNNNRNDGIDVNLSSGAQFNIHDNSATGNGNANIEPTASQIAAFGSFPGNDVSGYSAANVNVTGRTTVIQGVTTNLSNLGGVNQQTSNYALTAGDQGKLVRFNTNTALTCTLPSTLPADFCCCIIEEGTGTVVLGPNVDQGGTLTLNENQSVFVYYDGSNWNTVRGLIVPSPFITPFDSSVATGSISSTTVFFNPITQMIHIAVYVSVASSSAGMTLAIGLDWTDENGNVQTAGSGTFTFSGGGNGWVSLVEEIFAKASTNIHYSVTVTGTISFKAHVRAIAYGA